MNPLLKVNPPRPGLNPLKGKVNPLREILSKQCNKSIIGSPPPVAGEILLWLQGGRDLNHVRTCRRACALTSANTGQPLDFFSRPPQAKRNARKSLTLRQSENPVDSSRQDFRFVIFILPLSVFIIHSRRQDFLNGD